MNKPARYCWATGLLFFLVSFQHPEAVRSYRDEQIVAASVSEADWDKATASLNYAPPPPEPPKKNRSGGNLDFPDFDWDTNLGSGAFRVLLLLVLIGLITFVTARVLGGKWWLNNAAVPANADINAQLAEAENRLPDSPLDALLAQAHSQADYRAAIRLYYLLVIKALHAAGWIVWKKDKTNGAYLVELAATPLAADFKRVTHLFEYVWYGDVVPDAALFARVQPQFEALLAQIRTTRPPQR